MKILNLVIILLLTAVPTFAAGFEDDERRRLWCHPRSRHMVYLSGQRVTSPTRGLYIRNGKKVVIK